ncbi:Protein javelin [Eumeta japonica]|uniref:Protein javelin n=1 Tax=Eumeta variegata TaxID=151549 RepID=A0A4C1WEU3_EUMVA|nr:Protein javelin [Eumeta japonica]
MRCGLREDVVIRVERSMVRQFGHLERMNENTLTKQFYRTDVCDGKIGRGRPRKSDADPTERRRPKPKSELSKVSTSKYLSSARFFRANTFMLNKISLVHRSRSTPSCAGYEPVLNIIYCLYNVWHSVDSVASYSSQNHVDRIRTQNFSAASCSDDADVGSVKSNNFKRSTSNLEFPHKRPDSVTSNASSTRSRLRELVERKSQEDHKVPTDAVGDIQYFENPTETLEFDTQRNVQERKSNDDRPKKRKLNKSKNNKEQIEIKPKKQEKYQSKLAEYYKLPIQLPQDEFYQHLTRSKAAEDLLQRRFANSDTEFSGNYGRLCKHKETDGSNLRRSRSLAVIREETFTDLQLQNHGKVKRSQLIPRARLFDKPCLKDRLPSRAKYQTKEEVLEGLYIDSTASCFGDINGQPDIPHEQQIDKEDAVSQTESINSQSVSSSWPNLEENTSKHTNLSEDSIGHSRNPSDIDSLDSNYIQKHYNFEAHKKSNDREDTPDIQLSATTVESKNIYNTYEKVPYIVDNNQSNHNIEELTTNDNISIDSKKKFSSELDIVENPKTSTKYEISLGCKQSQIKETTIQIPDNQSSVTLITEFPKEPDRQSLGSEHDDTISSPPDSITSYISISIPSSPDKSHNLEYFTSSLAEKIDEYCDNDSINLKDQASEANETHDYSIICTGVNSDKLVTDLKYTNPSKTSSSNNDVRKKSNNETYITNTYIKCEDAPKKNNQFCSSSRNITTEPFVATLIENQYYSLPDINVSKCLRKSERIDAQLRREDPEDLLRENTYEVAHTHFCDILTSKSKQNYGQLNTIQVKKYNQCETPISETYKDKKLLEPQIIQNFTRLEDDLKSIITVNSSNLDDKECKEHDFFTQQNERELNEIEGTIRNNKILVKGESITISLEPEIYAENQSSTYTYSKPEKTITEVKKRTSIKKHYSLRQREPNDVEIERLPSPKTVEKSIIKESGPIKNKGSDIDSKKTSPLLSRVQSFKTSPESNITLIPLSGHQTIVIDPPINHECDALNRNQEAHEKDLNRRNQRVNQCNQISEVETSKYNFPISKQSKENIVPKLALNDTSTHIAQEPFIKIKLNKIVKTTIPKLKSEKPITDQNKFEKPPSRLIIKNDKSFKILEKGNITFQKMTRPQVLQVVDSKNNKQIMNKNSPNSEENKINQDKEMMQKENSNTTENQLEPKSDISTVKEKINNVIKTDIEYQEKLHSVKNYWSKLIDQKNESKNDPVQENKNGFYCKEQKSSENTALENCKSNPENSVSDIVKSIESVKIVDSIRKISQTKLHLWKDESEKLKSDSEIEETTVKKIVKQCENNINSESNEVKLDDIKKTELKSCARDTPEIEIVELSSNDNENKKTQATLIKAKGYERGCDEFDHVRYKVMKSELFKNSMIANYRKEAQFDGLLQYLQDYSFQELLVNNNIVIIEPVRTKIEPAPRSNTDTRKISPSLLKKNENNSLQADKSKSAVRRHFFYHPIRVNREIIEEELPHPDTVKKVRNLFEDTLKMKSPMTHDPPLVEETVPLTRRATSYRNLNEEMKTTKLGCKKKVTRQLTIDTSFGNKKWDNASLSSGVSSGDLSSNNEYETDGLSPFPHKNLKDNAYSSSSEEFLCESIGNDFCCETQYVSADALKKIRECGTSVTFYGGKVLTSKVGSVVSPMTKVIMDEIKVLQKNCSRDCNSCQTNCRGDTCSCLTSDNHKHKIEHNKAEYPNQDLNTPRNRDESFPGFKFKLVKSNSCSSRLELTGTDNNKNSRTKYRLLSQSKTDDPPLLNEEENSVKNKISRLESYSKGLAKTPFETKDNENNDTFKTRNGINKKVESFKHDECDENKQKFIESNTDNSKTNENGNVEENDTNNIQDPIDADPHSFEKKYYYLNDTINQCKNTQEKFDLARERDKRLSMGEYVRLTRPKGQMVCRLFDLSISYRSNASLDTKLLVEKANLTPVLDYGCVQLFTRISKSNRL